MADVSKPVKDPPPGDVGDTENIQPSVENVPVVKPGLKFTYDESTATYLYKK